MGWSCRADAGATLDKWITKCLDETQVQNVFFNLGHYYMLDVSNVEHEDGAITGSILRFEDGYRPESCGSFKATRVSSFRIEPCGCVPKIPSAFKHQHKDTCNRCLVKCDECGRDRCSYESPGAVRVGIGSGGLNP